MGAGRSKQRGAAAAAAAMVRVQTRNVAVVSARIRAGRNLYPLPLDDAGRNIRVFLEKCNFVGQLVNPSFVLGPEGGRRSLRRSGVEPLSAHYEGVPTYVSCLRDSVCWQLWSTRLRLQP